MIMIIIIIILRGPARLIQQPVRHSAPATTRYPPARAESCRMKVGLCLGAQPQGAADTNDKVPVSRALQSRTTYRPIFSLYT